MREVELHSLLRNLIENAWRFTPPGGRVDVDLKADAKGERGGSSIRSTVTLNDALAGAGLGGLRVLVSFPAAKARA